MIFNKICYRVLHYLSLTSPRTLRFNLFAAKYFVGSSTVVKFSTNVSLTYTNSSFIMLDRYELSSFYRHLKSYAIAASIVHLFFNSLYRRTRTRCVRGTLNSRVPRIVGTGVVSFKSVGCQCWCLFNRQNNAQDCRCSVPHCCPQDHQQPRCYCSKCSFVNTR